MKISIVTVCYNSQNSIETTIQSVLRQTYKEIEYIIIDGASNDGTVEILNKYVSDNVLVISEIDDGLYDAMNKAANIATGEYILYMNSGDVFATDDAVEKSVKYLNKEIDILYGNVIRCKQDGELLERYGGIFKEMRLLLMGRMMCHQSMFTRTTVMKKYSFDMKYSITADYDFVMRAKRNRCRFKYVDITISKVDSVEGISSRKENLDIMRQQDDDSLKNNFFLLYCIVTPLKKLYRKFIL